MIIIKAIKKIKVIWAPSHFIHIVKVKTKE